MLLRVMDVGFEKNVSCRVSYIHGHSKTCSWILKSSKIYKLTFTGV